MTDFHEWYMVFATKEDAAQNGYPDAPYLEDYGLNRERFVKYIDDHKALVEKRDSDKFDKILNTIWFFLFSFGPFIIHAFRPKKEIEGTFIFLNIILITLIAYICHKVHFDAYTKVRDQLYDKDIELYVANIRRYQEKYNEYHKNEQQKDSLAVDRLSQWTVKESRSFTQEEIDSVVSNVIVASEYGNSVCFTMKSGGQTYIPLHKTSTAKIGESIDMRRVEVLTLEKVGEANIIRIKA